MAPTSFQIFCCAAACLIDDLRFRMPCIPAFKKAVLTQGMVLGLGLRIWVLGFWVRA